MSGNLTSRQSRTGAVTPDLDELQHLPTEHAGPPVMRGTLLPQEEELSLPTPLTTLPTPITSLTRFLGPTLTVANPVWGGDPVPAMRGLQKKLVEYSLTLEEADRSDFMTAISVVESAVRLRLRYQQMRMNEAEMETKPAKADGERSERAREK